jgi:ubiquitin carboxyl-terminal hydrolase 25
VYACTLSQSLLTLLTTVVVVELRKLFQSMINTTATSVTPDQEVALLTLVGSDKAETVRRQSMRLGAAPAMGRSLGEINGMPLLGPLGPPPPAPPPPVPEDADTNGIPSREMNDKRPSGSSTFTPVDGDNSSEATLVSHPGNDDFMIIDTETQDKQLRVLDDKENLPPSKDETDAPGHPALEGILTDTSPSKLNEQPSSQKKETGRESEAILESPVNGPPIRPPPVPPRPVSHEKKADISKEIQIGAQQDVGEVINNVLFQFQCAIKADNFDENGEQIDRVKKLFFGKTRSYIRTHDNKERSQEEFFSDLKVNVVSGPKDIYAALDGAFDEQEVDVEGAKARQYTSVSKLPLILSVQVQRAQYNSETRTSYKSLNHLELKETIFMDRYMDAEDPELMSRRKACWEWKRQLRELEARRDALTGTEVSHRLLEI